MDPLTIITGITTAISIAQSLINVGKSADPLITSIYNRITNKPLADVTQADLDAVAAVSDQMTADLMKPLDTD